MSRLDRRLRRLEGRSTAEVQVILIAGGLPDHPENDRAIGDGGLIWWRKVGESVPEFRARAETEATAVRASFIVFGGLPERRR